MWKKLCLSTVSESKLYVFPQCPNENYIYFHNFRMETTYFSTASESKLYVVAISSGDLKIDYNILRLFPCFAAISE